MVQRQRRYRKFIFWDKYSWIILGDFIRDFMKYVDKKFGKICKCGKRHIYIATHGENLPKNNLKCKGGE